MAKQNQHKVPRVYLRQFGYKTSNGQWKVSVLKRGETFTRQKSIESFTAVTNIFDIDSHDDRISKMFEKLNGDLETEFNNIIFDLESNGTLSDKSYAYVLQIIANFVARSDQWREWILGMLNHSNKENFLHTIIGHRAKDFDEFKKLKDQDFFKILVEGDPQDVVNRVLLFFTDHLMLRLEHYEIVIVKSEDGKPWHTSTNPVVMHNRTGALEIFSKDSEIYFPLSPEYMAYLHYNGSDDKENKLRQLESNKIHQIDGEKMVELAKIVASNPSEYLIFPFEFVHGHEGKKTKR